MTVLKARIGGAWVPITSDGIDEVWIGTDEPTDPNIELWYDPDAEPEAPIDPIHLWNSAWGAVSAPVHSTTAGTAGVADYAVVPGLSATFTPVAGRRYRLITTVDYRQPASSPTSAIYVQFWNATAGATLFNSLRTVPATASAYGTITISQPAPVLTPDVPITVQVRVQSVTSAVGLNQFGGSTLVVEDIGPATVAPVVPADPIPTPVWTPITLEAPFTNLGGTWAPAAYTVIDKQLRLRGALAASGATAANQAIWNVPTELIPASGLAEIFAIEAVTNVAPATAPVARADVRLVSTQWAVTLSTATTSVNHLSLSGITWQVA